MSDIEKLLEDLKAGVEEVIRDNVKTHVTDTVQDGRTFIDNIKNDLEKYTTQLAEGTITKEKFENLLLDLRDRTEAKAMLTKIKAKARAEKIKRAIFSVIIVIVLKRIP